MELGASTYYDEHEGDIAVIVTTTNTIEGKEIEEYLGIVAGEVILGANVVRDFLASITDIIGGRSGTYESKLAEGREMAIKEMVNKARSLAPTPSSGWISILKRCAMA